VKSIPFVVSLPKHQPMLFILRQAKDRPLKLEIETEMAEPPLFCLLTSMGGLLFEPHQVEEGALVKPRLFKTP
jgi:hypothetical protein